MNPNTYNYAHVRQSHYDLASFNGPAVGDAFPELVTTNLDGDHVPWSNLTGSRLVIETASATCPMYAKSVPAMQALAADYPDTTFVVLYVREAHPGEALRPHDNIKRKLSAAQLLETRHKDQRLVLVDDLRGSAHQVLGGLPNMVYIVSAEGTVEFRGDWTDAAAVEAVLSSSASAAMLQRKHFPPAKPSPRVAIRTLVTGGWIALADFAIALPGLIRQHRRADRTYRIEAV